VPSNGGEVEKSHQRNIKEKRPSPPVARNVKAVALSSPSPNGRENDEELSDLWTVPFNTINGCSDTIVLGNFSEAERLPV
jgi:hypothetical protein